MNQTSESIKIRPEHLQVARGISLDTGLPIVRSLGVALNGWAMLPTKVRERLVRAAREQAVQTDRRRAVG